ncbi:MAG TPA: GAF domain-containing protein [Pyrinomonadaceae bacterium]|jgi:signal transduction protein with GAF and PtsI domain|nr:GAF domain-containing protein [Pyrinomonadaceae bacterium]
MSETTRNDLPEKFQRLIETLDIANILTEPLKRSIESLLRISAAELESGEASVLIREGETGDLRFLSAIGEVAGQLLNLKVPAGKGIAGFVLSSGQPMAIADVGETESFYAEVDKTTGFSTQMILATPLRHNDEVIGVLEYVNRSGVPPFHPFTPEEMDKAAMFADAIAALVNAYESAKILRDFGENAISASESDTASVRSWLKELRNAPEHREMMDLAVLIRDIATRGETERRLCREVLEAVMKFADSKSDTSFLSF